MLIAPKKLRPRLEMIRLVFDRSSAIARIYSPQSLTSDLFGSSRRFR